MIIFIYGMVVIDTKIGHKYVVYANVNRLAETVNGFMSNCHSTKKKKNTKLLGQVTFSTLFQNLLSLIIIILGLKRVIS